MQGKLKTSDLMASVFKNTGARRKEVLLRPSVGEDCAALDMGDKALIMSMDPISATSADLGRLVVRVNSNDIAAQGAEPYAMMLCLLMPISSSVEDVALIMKSASDECKRLNIEIIGGHTEFTTAVNRPTCCGICFANKDKSKLMSLDAIRENDLLVIAGAAGIEGTAILAHERPDEIESACGAEVLHGANAMIEETSVAEIGKVASENFAKKMHDVTEGGIYGAIWELCEGSNLGCSVNSNSIPVRKETRLICKHFGISPYRLLGSGSMLIVVSPEHLEKLLTSLKRLSEDIAVIGEFKNVKEGRRTVAENGSELNITEPSSDELYEVLK